MWWTHTLNRSNNFQLEVITFVIPSLVAPAFEIISHWKALDATLTRRDYRSLRRVNFIVAVGSELWSQGSVSTTPRADRLVDFISCSCERLAEMGLLYVGIVDGEYRHHPSAQYTHPSLRSRNNKSRCLDLRSGDHSRFVETIQRAS